MHVRVCITHYLYRLHLGLCNCLSGSVWTLHCGEDAQDAWTRGEWRVAPEPPRAISVVRGSFRAPLTARPVAGSPNEPAIIGLFCGK